MLVQFLIALGLPPSALPRRCDEQVSTYLSLTAGRRVLVVLDDVGSAAQIRDLLPGSPGSAVLATSRHELAGLAVAPGSRRVVLGPLCPADGVELLRSMLGAGRVDDDPVAAADLVDLCGGSPLALRVASARLKQRPGLPLIDYARHLDAGLLERAEGMCYLLRGLLQEYAALRHALDRPRIAAMSMTGP